MSSSSETRSLARKHLDRRLARLRAAADLTRPPRGWIKAMREAIGMTTAQLARRTGVSQSRIPRIEQGEVNGSVTLKTLRTIAEGMDCTLVYALVPNKPLDDMLRERASQIAERQLALTHHTMKLEDQALAPSDLKDERDRLVAKLLGGDARRLWDTP